MLNKMKNQKGFTLVELMISLGLLVIVMGAIYAFLNTSTIVSANINKSARWQSTVLTTMQSVRSCLANAADVSIVDVDEAMNNRQAGYNYIYCGPNGGVTLFNGTNETSYATSASLKNAKVFVTFKGQDLYPGAIPAEYYNLDVFVKLYPCDYNDSNAITDDSVFFDSARQTALPATDYRIESSISFHNCPRIKTAYDTSNYAMARAIRYKEPDPSEIQTLISNESTESTSQDPSATTTTTANESNSQSTTVGQSEEESSTETTTRGLDGYFNVTHTVVLVGSDYYDVRVIVDNQTEDDVDSWEYDIEGLPSEPVGIGTWSQGTATITSGKAVHVTGGFIPSGDVSTYNLRIYFTSVPSNPTFEAQYVVDSVSGNTVRGHIHITNTSAFDANGTTKWNASYTFDTEVLSFDGWGWGSVGKTKSGNTMNLMYYESNLAAGQSKDMYDCNVKIKDADAVEVTIHFDNSNILTASNGETFSSYWYNNGDYNSWALPTSSGTTRLYVSPGQTLQVGLRGSWSTNKPGQSYTYATLKNTPITDIWVQGTNDTPVSPTQPSNWGTAPDVTLTTTTSSTTESTTETTTLASDDPGNNSSTEATTQATTESTTETTTAAADPGTPSGTLSHGDKSVGIPAEYAGKNVTITIKTNGANWYYALATWDGGYTFSGTPSISYSNGGTEITINTNGGTGNLVFNCGTNITEVIVN